MNGWSGKPSETRQLLRQGKPTAALMHRQFSKRLQDVLIDRLAGCTIGELAHNRIRVYDGRNDTVYYIVVERPGERT